MHYIFSIVLAQAETLSERAEERQALLGMHAQSYFFSLFVCVL